MATLWEVLGLPGGPRPTRGLSSPWGEGEACQEVGAQSHRLLPEPTAETVWFRCGGIREVSLSE